MLTRGLALLLAFLLAGCGKTELYQQESYVFGTRVQISIWGLPQADAARHAQAVLAELDRFHARLHAWQPSEVTRLNAAFAAGRSAPIDAELQALLLQARDYAQRSDQLFNPALGKLVALWGFHRDTYAPVTPDSAQLKALLRAAPTLDDLVFADGQVRSRKRELALDLGGFAKGWALDRAATYLRSQRVVNALINIGGNVLALGSKDGEPWVVGIQHPREPRAMASLALRDGEAIGTSGDYQRYFTRDGVRFSHLLDPRSGQPARELQAVSVIAPPSLVAGSISDAATKPIFIAGKQKALMFSERFGIRDILLLDQAGNAYVSASLQSRLQWLVPPKHIYRLY